MNSALEMKRINPMDYPTTLMVPKWTSGIIDWLGHIPFAAFAMQACQPRLFVELGVYCGDSFGAFAQAASLTSPATKLVGIDKWEPTFDTTLETAKGDKSQVYYPQDRIQAFMEAMKAYPQAELRKNTFDAERDSFADGSIDLLHIDGGHMYDEVKHDYESWLPKMSRRGVILFHDIAVHGYAHSEVDRFWEEVKEETKLPFFEFYHSAGMGVLGVGELAEIPEQMRLLFLAQSEGRERKLRQWFTFLGDRTAQLVVYRYSVGTLPKDELGRHRSPGSQLLGPAGCNVDKDEMIEGPKEEDPFVADATGGV